MTTPIDLIISQMGEHITLLYGNAQKWSKWGGVPGSQECEISGMLFCYFAIFFYFAGGGFPLHLQLQESQNPAS